MPECSTDVGAFESSLRSSDFDESTYRWALAGPFLARLTQKNRLWGREYDAASAMESQTQSVFGVRL